MERHGNAFDKLWKYVSAIGIQNDLCMEIMINCGEQNETYLLAIVNKFVYNGLRIYYEAGQKVKVIKVTSWIGSDIEEVKDAIYNIKENIYDSLITTFLPLEERYSVFKCKKSDMLQLKPGDFIVLQNSVMGFYYGDNFNIAILNCSFDEFLTSIEYIMMNFRDYLYNIKPLLKYWENGKTITVYRYDIPFIRYSQIVKDSLITEIDKIESFSRFILRKFDCVKLKSAYLYKKNIEKSPESKYQGKLYFLTINEESKSLFKISLIYRLFGKFYSFNDPFKFTDLNSGIDRMHFIKRNMDAGIYPIEYK